MSDSQEKYSTLPPSEPSTATPMPLPATPPAPSASGLPPLPLSQSLQRARFQQIPAGMAQPDDVPTIQAARWSPARLTSHSWRRPLVIMMVVIIVVCGGGIIYYSQKQQPPSHLVVFGGGFSSTIHTPAPTANIPGPISSTLPATSTATIGAPDATPLPGQPTSGPSGSSVPPATVTPVPPPRPTATPGPQGPYAVATPACGNPGWYPTVSGNGSSYQCLGNGLQLNKPAQTGDNVFTWFQGTTGYQGTTDSPCIPLKGEVSVTVAISNAPEFDFNLLAVNDGLDMYINGATGSVDVETVVQANTKDHATFTENLNGPLTLKLRYDGANEYYYFNGTLLRSVAVPLTQMCGVSEISVFNNYSDPAAQMTSATYSNFSYTPL